MTEPWADCIVMRRNLASRNAAPVRGSYLCDPSAPDCPDRDESLAPKPFTYCWHTSLQARLAWQGGPSANADADLAAWNSLGSRTRAAA